MILISRFSYLLFFIIIFNILFSCFSKEACPRDCLGRGTCDISSNSTTGKHWYSCNCYTGFTGPDCSMRTCISDLALASKPFSLNVSHDISLECSGQGMCNRDTGRCQCFPGFEGNACNRMSCLNNCHNRGTCMTIGKQYDRYVDGATEGSYTKWDSNRLTSCVCDHGFTGPTCNIRMCPKGDDPLTVLNGYRTIIIDTTTNSGNAYVDGGMNGTFRFTFMGESINFNANASRFTSVDCKRAFEAMPVFTKISCDRSIVSTSNGGAVYTIKIKEFPEYPHENNVWTHDGNPALTMFKCTNVNVVGAPNPSCTLSETSVNNPPEYATCSNRGICNTKTGACACFEGFYEASCSQYTYAVREIKSQLPYDVLGVSTVRPSFNGVLAKLHSRVHGDCDRTGTCVNSTFKFIQATASTGGSPGDVQNVFDMDGNGNIVLYRGGWTQKRGGLDIYKKGLVATGGLTIMQQGLKIQPGFGVTINSGGLNTDGSLTLAGGGVSITFGGLVVTGGISIPKEDLPVTGGLDLVNGGLTVEDGMYVAGGLTIETSGLKTPIGMNLTGDTFVFNRVYLPYDGLRVTGGMTVIKLNLPDGNLTIFDGGLYVNATSIYSKGLHVTGGITIQNDGIKPPVGLTIFNKGLIVTGGLSIEDTGLTIVSGGIPVTGGVTLHSGPLHVNTSLTVYNQGLNTTDAVTIHQNGLHLTGGISIKDNGGLVVTNGVSVSVYGSQSLGAIGGMRVDGGVTVHQGLYMHNGLTIPQGGVWFEDAQTVNITDSKLTITDGLTINSDGLYIRTAGVTIPTDGLKITDGLTLWDTGLVVKLGNLNLPDSRLRLTGGLSIKNSGLKIDLGGLTIQTHGLTITTGGVTVPVDGLTVTAGGFTVENGGVSYEAGGLSLEDLKLPLGVTLKTHQGLNAEKQVSIPSGGLLVPQHGITVGDGLTISDSMTIRNNGLVLPTASTGFKHYIKEGIIMTGQHIFSDGSGGTTGANNEITIQESGLIIVTGGLSIARHGLKVTDGAVSVDGGIIIHSGQAEHAWYTRTAGLTIKEKGLYITDTGLSIKNVGPGNFDAYFGRYGLKVTDGLTILNTGVVLAAGGGGRLLVKDTVQVDTTLKIFNKGISIDAGLVIPDDGLLISSGGLTIVRDALKVTGGVSVWDVGLKVTNGVTIEDSKLYVTGGVTLANGNLRVTGGVTVFNNGLLVTGGVSVKDSQNLYLEAGDLTVTEHLYLEGGIMEIPAGHNLKVNFGGVTIETLGVCVVDGGVIVDDGGVIVQEGGLRIENDGVKITGGLTIKDLGLKIKDAITIASDLYIHNDGLHIMDTGWTIPTDGLTISDGLTINSGGLFINADSGNAGLTVIRGGVQVEGGNLMVVGAAHVNDGVVVETTGVEIYNSGVKVLKGGVTVPIDGLRVDDVGGISVLGKGLYTANYVDIVEDGVIVTADGVRVIGDVSVTGTLSQTKSLHIGDELKIASGLSINLGGLKTKEPIVVEENLQIHGHTFIWSKVVGSNALDVDNNLFLPRAGLVFVDDASNTLTIAGGGLKIEGIVNFGGVSVNNGGLVMADTTGNKITYEKHPHNLPLYVKDGALDVLHAVSVHKGGVVVADHASGGMTVHNAGVKVPANGVTVAEDGLFVNNGGLTVNGNLYLDTLNISSSVTLADSGMIAPKMTIVHNGLIVKGNAVQSVELLQLNYNLNVPLALKVHEGLITTSGVTVHDSGVLVKDGGVLVSDDGLTVTIDGLKVSGGLSIVTGNLICDGGLTLPNGDFPLHLPAGLTIETAGLAVTGGMTIHESLYVAATGTTHYGVHVKQNGFVYKPPALSGGGLATDIVDLVGQVSIADNGLLIAYEDPLNGSPRVNFTGTASVTGGMTVTNKGVNVLDGNVVVGGGLTVATGIVSMTGTLNLVDDNLDIVELKGHDDLYVDAQLTCPTGLYVGNKLTILEDGLSVVGGVTIPDSRIDVSTGSLHVTGGLSVVGGVTTPLLSEISAMTIVSGNLNVPNKLSISDTGLFINNGLVVTGGMSVGDATLTVPVILADLVVNAIEIADELIVKKRVNQLEGGTILETGIPITIQNGGFAISGGLTAPVGIETDTVHVYGTSPHLTVQGGLYLPTPFYHPVHPRPIFTVANTGVIISQDLVVSGAVTMQSQSTLNIPDGLSVASNGLKVTGGLTINDLGATMPTLTLATNLGVKVTGGVTVPSNLYSNVAVTLARGNLHVGGGCTISDNLQVPQSFVASDYTQAAGGVTVTAGGVKVGGGGLKVTGGVTQVGGLILSHDLMVSGQLTVVGALTTARLDPVTNGITIDQNGWKIENSGLVPSSLNITATGLTVEGGLTVWNSINPQQHVKAADKVNVVAGGVNIKSSSQGRFKISDTSTINVATVTVVDQGLHVNGGLTLYNNGQDIPGDLTANEITVSSTLHADAGMTASTIGSINALTVTAGGLNIGGLLTANAMTVEGGTVVGTFLPENGIVVRQGGGLTVSGGGIVAENGFDVTGNMLIYDNHLYLDDGLEVGTGNDLRIKKGNLIFKNRANNNEVYNIVSTGVTATQLSVYSGGLYIDGNVDIKMGDQRTGGTIKNNMLVGGAMTVNKEMIAGTACSVTSGGLKVSLSHGDQGSSTNYANVQQSPELFVHGDIYFDDTSLEGTHAAPATRRTSDAQFKTQVKDVKGAMAMLNNVRGVVFSYDEDQFSKPLNNTSSITSTTSSNGKSNVPMRLGVIAQEVQKAIPEAVSESNTQQGYLGVDYFKLVPILIEALRELVDRLKVVETIQSKKSQEMQNNNNHINTTISKGQLFKVFKALLKEEEELMQEHDKLTTRIDHLYKKIPSL